MLVETTAIALALYVYSNCIVDFFVSFFDSAVMLFTVKTVQATSEETWLSSLKDILEKKKKVLYVRISKRKEAIV